MEATECDCNLAMKKQLSLEPPFPIGSFAAPVPCTLKMVAADLSETLATFY
jgi:hypothetical protein